MTSARDAYFRMFFVKCHPLCFMDLRICFVIAEDVCVQGQSSGPWQDNQMGLWNLFATQETWLPGEGHLCSHVRPLTICPQPSHGISTHREQLPFLRSSRPSVPLPGHSSRLPWASVCAEGLLVFHESFESHCPLFLHLSDTNAEVLKGTCCCWSLAVTIVPRDCESSSLRPVSCFRGNPESQMITSELLTLLDK